MGDINSDGRFDIDDATFLLEIAVKAREATPEEFEIGDLTGDGRIDSADAILLLRLFNELSINEVGSA